MNTNKQKIQKSIEYLKSITNYNNGIILCGKTEDEIVSKIFKHAKKYNLSVEICAWYEDIKDFCSDWRDVGFDNSEAKDRYYEGRDTGEFQRINGFGIIRYAI